MYYMCEACILHIIYTCITGLLITCVIHLKQYTCITCVSLHVIHM